MEYLKRLFDITIDTIFSSWTPLAIAVAVLLGVLEYVRLYNAGDLSALDKFIDALKISSIAVVFCLMATLLFYAPLRAWLDEHNKLTTANQKLEVKQKNKAIRDGLGQLLYDAIIIQQQCRGFYLEGMPKEQTIDDRIKDWLTRTKAFLKNNLEPSHEVLFENIISGTPVMVPPGMTPQNAANWGMVEQYKQQLEKFLREYRDPNDATKS